MSQLDLKLPENPTSISPKPQSSPVLWRCFIGAGVLAAAAGAWWPQLQPRTYMVSGIATAASVGLPFSEELLLRLSKAGAWQEAAKLLDSALINQNLTPQRKAELHLKKGDFLVNAEKFPAALSEFYRADLLQSDDDFSRKIDQRIIDTLRQMGRYDTIGEELSQKNRARKNGDDTVKPTVVAKVDGEEILLSDFRKQVDLEIERRLMQAKATEKDPAKLKQLEEQLRQQFSAPGEQWKLLQQYVSQKVLVREAEQWKLEEHPEFKKQMETIRSQLLAQLLMETKVEPQNISDMDVNNYIEANRESLGLSTEPGQLSPQDLQQAMPKAKLAYTELKRQENQAEFQKSLMERHQVEIFREAFTEGQR